MSRRHYVELVLYKTYAELRVESARTYIGFLWWVIDPIVSMCVYYVAFGVLLQNRTEDYVPFLFLGLVPWRWQTASMVHAGKSLIAGRHLMQQVDLPKVVFPVVTILSDAIKFSFVFVVLLIFLWIYGTPVTSAYVALPAVLLAHFLFIGALCFLLAAVVPFMEDIQILVDYGMRLLFFVSGIFWSIERIDPRFHEYVRLNPFFSIVDSYRKILLYGEWPSPVALLWIGLLSLGGCILGIAIIRRYDWTYPKLV